MKSTIAFLTAILVTGSAFASETTYLCDGKDDGEKSVLTVIFKSESEVLVVTEHGDEYDLPQTEPNEPEYKTFGFLDYDGYGGSVLLNIPASFSLASTEAAAQFQAKFDLEVYSESGRVYSLKFSGLCQKAK